MSKPATSYFKNKKINIKMQIVTIYKHLTYINGAYQIYLQLWIGSFYDV